MRYLVHASLISVFAVVGICEDNEGTPLDRIDPADPVDPCLQAPADCEPSESVIDSFPVPLVDGGGLYGEGSNRPPEFHVEAGIRAGAQVPLSGAVLAAIGMSNTLLEFEAFKKLAPGSTDAVVAPTACWACTVRAWDSPSGRGWTKANNWLASHGYAPEDVDVVWLKATRQKDQSLTADDLERILVVLRAKWPNTRQVFVSDRIYVGYLSAGAEPSGGWRAGPEVREFVLRHLGETEPWIGWGPYLWANGEHARSDGMSWLRSDYREDMLHVNQAGAGKVAELLIEFLSTTPEAVWFRR